MHDDANDDTMTSPLIYKSLLSIPGAVLSGLSVYFVFSYLVLPIKITAPVSIIISLLVFGLTMSFGYNAQRQHSKTNGDNDTRLSKVQANNKNNNENNILPNTIFVGIYIIFLVISALFSKPNLDLFVHWENLTLINLILLSAAIGLSFFLPGYAVISIIDKKGILKQPLKVLLAYIFSTLISGMAGYISASLGFTDLQIKILLIIVHTIIVVLFLKKILNKGFNRKTLRPRLIKNRILRVLMSNANVLNKMEVLIFSSLFALVVFSTYYMYGGVIIGDQWYHHGKALVFMSGVYKDLASAGIGDFSVPPFLSALLASIFTLSSVPSVNAYVSINFLNFMPVIAFYYFLTKWIPSSIGSSNKKVVVLLATTLFMLSSGFGWVYLLNLAATTNPVTSQTSALNDLFIASIKTFDISTPNTFIVAGHPDITSGLIILALPAGFVLLGLIREDINDRIRYFAIVVTVSTLGVFSHDEFNLFIIVASILLVIFRPPARNYIFAAFLVSISFQVLADTILPGHYYTIRYIPNTENLGVPLIAIFFMVVVLAWAIDVSKIVCRLGRHLKNITADNMPITSIRKIAKSHRFRLILGVAIISVVFCVYVLSFIIWGSKIPFLDIRTDTNGLQIVPWYFYPLRFGITGLLGLCFILSYIFKKFEKEVVVFAVIAILAFLTGHYYDEDRFNKYIMVSFSAFASLLLYRLLVAQKENLTKTLVSGIIIACVITSSSLSILMYLGYTGLALKNPSQQFDGWLPRRYFPSDSDIHMLNYLHRDLDLRNAVIAITASAPEPVSPFAGLNAKLIGFVGTEVTRTFSENPLILNASTLEGFYDLLHNNGIRYIVLPKTILGTEKLAVPQFVSFALQDFVKVYQNKYTVLSVPKLTSPSSRGDVALVLQREPSLLSDRRDLPYNNESFGNVINSKSVKIIANGKIAFLNGNVTLLSNTNINTNTPIWKYFETRFQIINETNNKDNHAGVVWNIGHKGWYAFLRDNRLSVWNSVDKEFLHSQTIKRENGIWYTLKVIVTENTINIYLNDVLQFQIPKDPYEKNINRVDRVGIRTYNTAAEFEAIRFGMIPEGTKGLYTHYYYPLSMLALSNMRYDTFIENDLSVLSKGAIVLPSDPLDVNQMKRYLQYVNTGGIIIVFNTDNNYTGGFSKLLAIQPSSSVKYDSIANQEKQREAQSPLSISGIAKAIKLEKPSDVAMDSFYMKDNKEVAPFVVHKNYGKGRIIFVNIAGYYDAVLNSPSRYFLTLSRIPDLLNLRGIGASFFAGNTSSLLVLHPPYWYTGDLKVSGLAIINSSSFSFVNGSSYSYHSHYPHPPSFQFYAKDFSVLNKRANHQYIKDIHLKNALIKDIQLSGKYEVIINSSGQLYLPSSSSQYDYISMSIPSGFNMTLKVFPGSSAEFTIDNHTQPIRVNSGQIEFHNISPSLDVKHILVVLKRPQINVNGNSSSENLYFPDQTGTIQSIPLVMNGMLETEIDHVDYCHCFALPNTVKPITYLKWIKFNGNTNLK